MALCQVIEGTVKPGDLVLDSGRETGIPGPGAGRANGAWISWVDLSETSDSARGVCRASGLQNRATFFKDLSADVGVHERAGIVSLWQDLFPGNGAGFVAPRTVKYSIQRWAEAGGLEPCFTGSAA